MLALPLTTYLYFVFFNFIYKELFKTKNELPKNVLLSKINEE